mmetsp:Transcript_7947/g.32186  ORF Transcript_7947/g.32186 Transcript_7947/m.32186 type:complete len:377 (-) Transcript_7947:65-1195(-)
MMRRYKGTTEGDDASHSPQGGLEPRVVPPVRYVHPHVDVTPFLVPVRHQREVLRRVRLGQVLDPQQNQTDVAPRGDDLTHRLPRRGCAVQEHVHAGARPRLLLFVVGSACVARFYRRKLVPGPLLLRSGRAAADARGVLRDPLAPPGEERRDDALANHPGVVRPRGELLSDVASLVERYRVESREVALEREQAAELVRSLGDAERVPPLGVRSLGFVGCRAGGKEVRRGRRRDDAAESEAVPPRVGLEEGEDVVVRGLRVDRRDPLGGTVGGGIAPVAPFAPGDHHPEFLARVVQGHRRAELELDEGVQRVFETVRGQVREQRAPELPVEEEVVAHPALRVLERRVDGCGARVGEGAHVVGEDALEEGNDLLAGDA